MSLSWQLQILPMHKKEGFRSALWMTLTHPAATQLGQCERAALHLSAQHSPGIRWMTYSVTEVFEPVAGKDKKKKKETRLRKSAEEKQWVSGS